MATDGDGQGRDEGGTGAVRAGTSGGAGTDGKAEPEGASVVSVLQNAPTPMTRILLLAALTAAPLASAQTTSTTGQTDRGAVRGDYQMTYQADIDRLGRDLDGLDRTMRGDMRGDYTSLRQSYDELRAATPRTDMSDPAAARQARTDYDQRYDELAGDVYRARLTSARDRNDYFSAANDRVGTYDGQIRDLRNWYDSTTGDERADAAQDLIRLRAQRDAYRDRVYSARGVTRSGFDDAARRQATDALTRADADFNRARRDAMTRSMNGGSMDGSSM